MSANETTLIANLETAAADEKALQAALARIGEYMEETYILNLPPSKKLLRALESFAADKAAPAALKRRAKKWIKEYGI